MKNNNTTVKGTPFEKIRLIRSIIKSISQIATKKAIPKRNGSKSSLRTYLSIVFNVKSRIEIAIIRDTNLQFQACTCQDRG